MSSTIGVLLVDDHAVVRAGFRLLLSGYEAFKVVGEAERGEQAIQFLQTQSVDVIVMDLSMPGIGGLESIRRICMRDAQAKILVFSVHDEPVYINRAISAGAKGYISKNSAPDILPEAIQHLAAGKNYIEQGLLKGSANAINESNFQPTLDSLSPREFDVFLLLAKGLTVHKIADQLCVSYKTAANYSTQIKKKFQVASIAELTHIALVSGVMKT